jgi:biopolymer transport protein ExbD
MRAPVYKPVRRYGFNMTPMIDVTFLLLIFFLVASHLSRNESQLELDLPIAKSGSDDLRQAIPRIIVNVKNDGSLWLAGRTVDSDKLASLFKAAKSHELDEVEVRIRASRSAHYANVEPILMACAQAGIWNVSYAVYTEELK